METKRIGIILNGVTGRMGTNQHLERSLCSIIKDGGIHLESGAEDHAKDYPHRTQRGETPRPRAKTRPGYNRPTISIHNGH